MGGRKWTHLQLYHMSIASLLRPFVSWDLVYFKLDVFLSVGAWACERRYLGMSQEGIRHLEAGGTGVGGLGLPSMGARK